MADRYDALTVRESNGKSYFTKIGAMFASRGGDGFVLALDAVPASVDGQYRIILKVPTPRDDRERSANSDRQQAGQRAAQPAHDDLDDDIAF